MKISKKILESAVSEVEKLLEMGAELRKFQQQQQQNVNP